MNTSTVISDIKTVQEALKVISVFNILSDIFPLDTNVTNGTSFDYVIIGSGNAGSVVAARIVEAGHTALVLEAGDYATIELRYPGLVTYVKGSRADWCYISDPGEHIGNCRKNNRLMIAKSFGGAGGSDYPIYARGNPSDYDKWSKTVNDDSFKWQNMMKYFKRSEHLRDQAILNSPYHRYHSTEGKINITRESNDVCDVYIEGFKRAGQPVPLDNIGNADLGYSRGLYRVYEGTRQGATPAYISPIKDNPKLKLSLNSLATKIIFDENKNAVGVEFEKGEKTVTVNAKKEVIVSAGPIKSPQLLKVSGIGPKEELNKFRLACLSDLPVGKNLQNNVGTLLVHTTNRKLKPGPVTIHKFIAPLIVGYTAINKSSKYADYETLSLIIDNFYYFLSLCGFSLGLDNTICDQFYHEANKGQMLVTVLTNLNSTSRGEILLNSANPKDRPIIKTNYYSNKTDAEAIMQAIQHYVNITSTPYFKNMGIKLLYPASKCGDFIRGSNNYWKCYANCMLTAISRFVGTNSMGSVVDTKFNVYGVKRLRVVDASVIPNNIGGDPNAVIVATAEKAAETILGSSSPGFITRLINFFQGIFQGIFFFIKSMAHKIYKIVSH